MESGNVEDKEDREEVTEAKGFRGAQLTAEEEDWGSMVRDTEMREETAYMTDIECKNEMN